MPCFGTRRPLRSPLVTPPIPFGTEEKRHRYFGSPIDPVFTTTVSIQTVRETGAISQRALRYRIVDLATLGRIAWLCISQEETVLPQADVAEDFQQRPAYQEGCLTDQPDLSVYDQLFEDEEDEDDDRPW